MNWCSWLGQNLLCNDTINSIKHLLRIFLDCAIVSNAVSNRKPRWGKVYSFVADLLIKI